MSKKNSQRDAGITQEEVLEVLIASGRPNFTKRQLTHFSSEAVGLLPKLRRTSRPDSNAPVFIWNEDVLEQLIELYDLVERGNRGYRTRLLYLWLREYEVPFAPILQCWIQSIDAYLHDLTQGKEDPDDALWQIGVTIFERMIPKWKFSPQPDELVRSLGIEAWQELTEFSLDMLLVPTYEPDEIACESVRETLKRIAREAKSHSQKHDDTLSPGTFTNAEEVLSWFQMLQEIFSLPQLRVTLLNATREEWTQARTDYLLFCHLLKTLAELFPRRSARLTLEIRQTLFFTWGSFLPPLLLAVRSHGHGDKIDETLAFLDELINEILCAPDFRALLAKM